MQNPSVGASVMLSSLLRIVSFLPHLLGSRSQSVLHRRQLDVKQTEPSNQMSLFGEKAKVRRVEICVSDTEIFIVTNPVAETPEVEVQSSANITIIQKCIDFTCVYVWLQIHTRTHAHMHARARTHTHTSVEKQ